MASFPLVENYNDFDPHDALVLFLRALDVQFREALDETPGLLIPTEFHDLARAAYEPVPATIAQMADLVSNEQIDLRPHALYGAPLALKLNMVARQSQRYEAARGQARQVPGPVRRLFKKLLEIIDTLLESLVDSLPLGGLVVEFKKGLEHLVPDDFGETH